MKTFYAVCEPGKVVLEEKELRRPQGREVLLKARYSAMSPGTEKMLMREEIFDLPKPIGYAMVGEVIAVGDEVRDFRVGDYAATTGEHAQYLIMDEWNCTPCPPEVDLRQAAFFTLAHTGLFALRQSRIQLGEACVVLGQGFVGAITAQCAKMAGAMPVIVTDLDEGRLEAARKMGIHYTVNANDKDALKNLMASLGLPGAPVVFEATGVREPLIEAMDVLGERGRLVLVSTVHGGGLPPIDEVLFKKGASLIGTYVNSKPFKLKRADLNMVTWPPLISEELETYSHSDCWTSDEDIRTYFNMLRYGNLDITPLISHEFDWHQIPEAYDQYVWKQDTSLTGGVIRWG